MSFVMQRVDRIDIAMAESNFTIVYADQPAFLVHTDGDKWTDTIDGQGEVEFRAKYKSGELELERQFKQGGMTVIDVYRYDDDGDRLELTTRVSGGRLPQSVRITRIFDRADG